MAKKPQRLRTFIEPDCLVIGFEQLAKSRDLPDPGDSHVAAVAIEAGAQGFVSNNLKNFPSDWRHSVSKPSIPVILSSFKKRKTKLLFLKS